MEVKLVLIDLLEMLLNVVEILESKSELTLPHVGLSTFDFIPHALHVMDIEVLVISTLLAEQCHGLLCLLQLIDPDHVSRGHSIEISVGKVQLPGLVVQSTRSHQVSLPLDDLSLQNVEIKHSRGVLDGFVNIAESLLEVPLEIKVLSSEVCEPELDRRVLLLLLTL